MKYLVKIYFSQNILLCGTVNLRKALSVGINLGDFHVNRYNARVWFLIYLEEGSNVPVFIIDI